MVFRRRDRRPIWQAALEFLYPRGGWRRAFEYVNLRLRRLPDTPEKIARGIWAGVFVTFTPFFGLHFVIAWILARLMRGNVLAALTSTFFGNPLTYVPIAATSMWFGNRMLGRPPRREQVESMGEQISGAWQDLWHNFLAVFSPEKMEWGRLAHFYDQFFKPFMVGSIIPGIIAGTICYALAVPVIRVYQNQRKKRLEAKLRQLSAAKRD